MADEKAPPETAKPAGPAPMILIAAIVGALVAGAATGNFVVAPRLAPRTAAQPAAHDEAEKGSDKHGGGHGDSKSTVHKIENLIVNPAGSAGHALPDGVGRVRGRATRRSRTRLREHDVQVRDVVIGDAREPDARDADRAPGARDSLQAAHRAARSPPLIGRIATASRSSSRSSSSSRRRVRILTQKDIDALLRAAPRTAPRRPSRRRAVQLRAPAARLARPAHRARVDPLGASRSRCRRCCRRGCAPPVDVAVEEHRAGAVLGVPAVARLAVRGVRVRLGDRLGGARRRSTLGTEVAFHLVDRLFGGPGESEQLEAPAHLARADRGARASPSARSALLRDAWQEQLAARARAGRRSSPIPRCSQIVEPRGQRAGREPRGAHRRVQRRLIALCLPIASARAVPPGAPASRQPGAAHAPIARATPSAARVAPAARARRRSRPPAGDPAHARAISSSSTPGQVAAHRPSARRRRSRCTSTDASASSARSARCAAGSALAHHHSRHRAGRRALGPVQRREGVVSTLGTPRRTCRRSTTGGRPARSASPRSTRCSTSRCRW